MVRAVANREFGEVPYELELRDPGALGGECGDELGDEDGELAVPILSEHLGRDLLIQSGFRRGDPIGRVGGGGREFGQ